MGSWTFSLTKRKALRYSLTVINDPLFSFKNHERKAFTCYPIYFSYVAIPSERLYWSDADAIDQAIVKNAISRNKYLKIKAYLHVQGNNSRPHGCIEKGCNVLHLIDMLNATFKKYGIFHRNLVVDENVFRLCGYHGLK